MELRKDTPLGTLTASQIGGAEYPGITIDLLINGKPDIPICLVEYESTSNCIQVVVYGDCGCEEPTTIAKIQLPGSIKETENGSREK